MAERSRSGALGVEVGPSGDFPRELPWRSLWPEPLADVLEREDHDALEWRDLAWPLEEGDLEAPVRRPGKIMCIALNHRDHCPKTGLRDADSPVLFAKLQESVGSPANPVAAT